MRVRQPLTLVITNDVYQRFTFVDHTTPSWFPTALRLAVAMSTHVFIAILRARPACAELTDEATLSPELHTPPLPATHVWVGYRWQNNGLRLTFQRCSSYWHSLVSHPNYFLYGIHLFYPYRYLRRNPSNSPLGVAFAENFRIITPYGLFYGISGITSLIGL